MKPRTAINFFGGITATADALDISRQAVHRWLKNGKIPQLREYQVRERMIREDLRPIPKDAR